MAAPMAHTRSSAGSAAVLSTCSWPSAVATSTAPNMPDVNGRMIAKPNSSATALTRVSTSVSPVGLTFAGSRTVRHVVESIDPTGERDDVPMGTMTPWSR